MTRLVAATLALALAANALPAQESIPLRIEMEPAASAHLLGMGEWLQVHVEYYGINPGSAEVPVLEDGSIRLGLETLTVHPVSQTVEFGGSLAATPLDRTAEPLVQVRAVSARLASDGDRLDCTIVQGPLAQVAAQGADRNVIRCGLFAQ